MKWSVSNKMKESFNCVTHPHPTSCAQPSPSPVGMDIGMNGWRTVWFVEWFYQFFAQLQTQPPSNTVLTHKHTQKDTFRLQMNLAAKRQSMRPYRRRKLPSLWWEFRCQQRTQRQRYRLVPSTIYGTKKKKQKKQNKADSEMPPRDFLEELIYSI